MSKVEYINGRSFWTIPHNIFGIAVVTIIVYMSHTRIDWPVNIIEWVITLTAYFLMGLIFILSIGNIYDTLKHRRVKE